MTTKNYKLILYKDSQDHFWGECPELNIYFAGKTVPEALISAQNLLKIHINSSNFELSYEIVDHKTL